MAQTRKKMGETEGPNVSPFCETLEILLKLRRLDQELLEAEMARYPTVTAFLSGVCPILSETAPKSVSTTSVASHTLGHLKACERRLLGCAKCPPEGGGCSTDDAGLDPGIQPVWAAGPKGVTLEQVHCDRWAEHLLRQRVRRAGVELRLSGTSLRDVSHRVLQKTGPRLGEFIEDLRVRTPCSLILAGTGSSEVAIATLRALCSADGLLEPRYVRMPSLGRPLKQFFSYSGRRDTVSSDPVAVLSRCWLLVMTEVTAKNPEWFDQVMCELVYSRYLANKPTLLATLDDPNIVADHYFRTAVPICLTQ